MNRRTQSKVDLHHVLYSALSVVLNLAFVPQIRAHDNVSLYASLVNEEVTVYLFLQSQPVTRTRVLMWTRSQVCL